MRLFAIHAYALHGAVTVISSSATSAMAASIPLDACQVPRSSSLKQPARAYRQLRAHAVIQVGRIVREKQTFGQSVMGRADA